MITSQFRAMVSYNGVLQGFHPLPSNNCDYYHSAYLYTKMQWQYLLRDGGKSKVLAMEELETSTALPQVMSPPSDTHFRVHVNQEVSDPLREALLLLC
jgi:hypothetical protein